MKRIEKYINQILVMLAGSWLAQAAHATEITAIDFNGEPMGQVISTGMVISPDGESIGYITADSLITDDEDKIIGGVVPQGVVIGMDNRLLGKIHTDGMVRSPSGNTLGRALPNGLVVNQSEEIIGAVLYPGLVYSADGATVGRVTGGGTYINLEGQEIGYVSANGYAYKKSGDVYVLDGRLMSAKMVVSLEGRFMGSIAPTGKVVNFEGKEIGNIHANGYVYDTSGKIIGGIVSTSYAFDMAGRYMGIVSYNGTINKGERVIGYYRPDGNIVNDKDEVIGFSVPLTATANDKNGRYLGRLILGGQIVRGDKIQGYVGAKGYIYDNNNNQIGSLVKTGPVFDVLANLRGQSMPNGAVVSLSGASIGQMRENYAYDSNGKMMGAVFNRMVAINQNNKALGSVGFDAKIKDGAEEQKISPFGYLMNADNKVIGRGYDLSGLYGLSGQLYSYMTPNGSLYHEESDVKMTQSGTLIGRNGYVGDMIPFVYALDWTGQNLGKPWQNNLIADNGGLTAYKVIPGNYVAGNSDQDGENISPLIGFSANKRIALSIGGDLIGYASNNGEVLDLNNNSLGYIKYRDYIEDNNQNIIGNTIPFAVVYNDKCVAIGSVNGHGDIINNRDVLIGRLLPNGQAVSDVGSYIGYTHFQSGLIDFDGRFAGTISSGQGLDASGKLLGCVDKRGRITDENKKLLYGIIESNPVIDFESNIIGYIVANGQVVNSKDEIIGYVQPNGNVVSKSQRILGNAMKYAVAYDQTNNFLGLVQSTGEIYGSTGDLIGKVGFDGSVQNNNDEIIGYALYDFYVYDENDVIYGYLTKDGTVLSPVGSKLGKMDRGFVVGRNGDVIARGNRDYIVRDVNNTAIGDLRLDGNVIDFDGKNVGYLNETGAILTDSGTEIAHATPLQYYTPHAETVEQPAKKTDWVDTTKTKKKPSKEEQAPKVAAVTEQKEFTRKVIGIALTPDGDIIGNIYDDDSVENENGDQVGYRTSDGIIVDMEHNPIGIEEMKRVSADNMFVPANAFGSGNQYGIGSKPSNLGPGGGHGQGERYDPVKEQALAKLQNQYRASSAMAEIHSGISPSNFTGYEEDGWPSENKKVSSWRVDMSQMILEDKPIPAVLARSVYASDGFSDNIPVTAIVERNIYAEEGRNIIIPAGSRVIGKMNGGDSGGNTGGAVKIGIQWERLIRPDGSQFRLGNAQTADAQGRSGAIGYLDQQLLKRYSMPLLTTALESGLAYITATGEGQTTSSNGETTESARSQAARDARESFIQKMDTIFEEILESKANIRAVTYIPAGTRIIIFPNEDLWLNSETRNDNRSDSDKPQKGRTLLTDTNKLDATNGSNQVTYNGNYNENVQPVSGGAKKRSSSLVGNTGGGKARPVQVPPSATSQETTSTNRGSDDIPDLL